MHARDIMIEPLTIAPASSVRELAKLLLDHRSDGACVVDDGRLVGIVTLMDLIYQEKEVHLPSILSIMDFAIPLEPPGRLRAELDKITGTRVNQIMTIDVLTTSPDAVVSEAATMMVEKHLTLVPVVEDGRLLGVITKLSLLDAVMSAGKSK